MDLKQTMLEQKNWAVVGATTNRERYGYKILKSLEKHGYHVVGISPKYEKIDDIFCYKSLSDLPEKPDVVNVVVNPAIAKNILQEAKDLGISYIFFQPNSYDEETLALGRKLGLEMLTNDCIYKTLEE